jgi:hypothetical protein
MDTAQLVWGGSGIAAFLLLPVGAIRMIAYRSGQIDHTPTMRLVARLALGLGGVALAVFSAMTLWLLLGDGRGH